MWLTEACHLTPQHCAVYVSKTQLPWQTQWQSFQETKCLFSGFQWSARLQFLTKSVYPLFNSRSILHPRSGLVWILCQQGQDSRLQRHHRAPVERGEPLKDLLLLYTAPNLLLHYHKIFHSPSQGVWDWAGGLPVPADPVLWEVLRQKHAQQGRQRDCGQDHGKGASPGKSWVLNGRPRKRAYSKKEVCVV